MNAPTIIPAPRPYGSESAIASAGVIEAIARHISSEGCQFIVISKSVKAGQRLSFTAEAMSPVTGTIRWVLGERIGFAFDQRIGAQAVAELSRHFATLKTIRLIASSPEQATG